MEAQDNVNLYVIYHIPYPRIQSPIFKSIYTRQGIVPDSIDNFTSDTGDNISSENPIYAEYTSYYWVWKNQLPCRYTGFFQYRRYISLKDNVTNILQESNMQNIISMYGWDQETLNSLVADYDVILPNPVLVDSIRSYYYYCNSGEYRLYLDVALQIIESKFPDYIEDCEPALSSNDFYCCNMFIMRTDLFNGYMEWIMEIFADLKHHFNPTYNRKTFAYLGERLFNIYLHHVERVSNARVKINPWVYIESISSSDFNIKLISPYFNY